MEQYLSLNGTSSIVCVKSRGFQDITDYQLTVSEEGRTEIIWWKLDIEVSIILTWHSMSGCGSGWAAVKSLDDKNHIWAPSSQLVNSDPTPKSPVETYWLECKAWVDAYQPEIFPNQAGRQRRHNACLWDSLFSYSRNLWHLRQNYASRNVSKGFKAKTNP